MAELELLDLCIDSPTSCYVQLYNVLESTQAFNNQLTEARHDITSKTNTSWQISGCIGIILGTMIVSRVELKVSFCANIAAAKLSLFIRIISSIP